MPRIPKASIKRLINSKAAVRITDKAADSISTMLEAKAREIARYALAEAKRNGRKTILKEDIDAYRLKFGD